MRIEEGSWKMKEKAAVGGLEFIYIAPKLPAS